MVRASRADPPGVDRSKFGNKMRDEKRPWKLVLIPPFYSISNFYLLFSDILTEAISGD